VTVHLQRRRLLVACLAIAAAVPTVGADASGASAATPHAGAAEPGGTETIEVFHEDGTISQAEVPAEPAAAPDSATTRMAAAATVTPLQETGPSSERLDVVFVGDGYTAEQIGTYHQHAAAIWAGVLAEPPFTDYQGAFNVWMVDVVSAESGIDGDPLRSGILRNTALDMAIDCSSLCLLRANSTKVRALAAAAPEVDSVIIMGNTSVGRANASYPSGGVGMMRIPGAGVGADRSVLHEFGHSIGNLVDEYLNGSPTARYTGSEPTQANVTTYTADQMRQNGAKWSLYLGSPTPDGGVIGTYEGTWFSYRYGVYRPSERSIMRSSGWRFSLVGLDAMERAIRAKATVPATDYLLTLPAGTGSAAAGTSAAFTAQTTKRSGPTENVTLTASGLPPGATADHGVVRTGGSRTFTIATSSYTPPGTYPVTVTATSMSGTRTATFQLVVTAPSSAACVGYALAPSASMTAFDFDYWLETGLTTSTGGTLRACLDEPDGAQFSLALQRLVDGQWQFVAMGSDGGPGQLLNYDGPAGTYRYVVVANSGSGAYTLAFSMP